MAPKTPITPERYVKLKIKSWLRDRGVYFFMPAATAYGVHGVPDIIACVGGRFVGIECKAPHKKGNTTRHQRDHIDRIVKSGGAAFVATSVEDVAEAFTRFGV